MLKKLLLVFLSLQILNLQVDAASLSKASINEVEMLNKSEENAIDIIKLETADNNSPQLVRRTKRNIFFDLDSTKDSEKDLLEFKLNNIMGKVYTIISNYVTDVKEKDIRNLVEKGLREEKTIGFKSIDGNDDEINYKVFFL